MMRRKEINMDSAVDTKDGEIREISKPIEAKVVEKVVYIDRRDRKLLRIKRMLSMLGCMPLFFCCFVFTYTVITKTDPYWSEIAKFLNSGSNFEEVNEDLSFEDAQYSFESQISEIGPNRVVLNNSELSALAKHNLSKLPNLKLVSQNGSLQLLWQLDKSGKTPLYARLDFRNNEENMLYISYIGFSNIGLPQNLSQRLSTALFPALQFTYGGKTPNELLSFILTGNESNEISNIVFQENKLSFDILISLSVFE